MKKIIILIVILCCMSYAKCKTYGGSKSVDIYCDRVSHENYNIKHTYLDYKYG